MPAPDQPSRDRLEDPIELFKLLGETLAQATLALHHPDLTSRERADAITDTLLDLVRDAATLAHDIHAGVVAIPWNDQELADGPG